MHQCAHHDHAPQNYGWAFAIGVTLNLAFVVVEVGFGLWSNSLALLADAGHNLSDVLGLLLAQWSIEGVATSGPAEGSNLAMLDDALVAFWFAWATFNPGTEIVEDL